MEKSSTSNQSTKETLSHQEAEEATNRLTTTTNKKLINYIVLGIFFISLLYAFEFVQDFSEKYSITETNYLSLKEENKTAINKLKQNSQNNEFYAPYIEVNKKYKAAVIEFNKAKETEHIFLFSNMRLFLYELLPILALFLYFSFNLYRSFKFERNNLGPKLIHGVFIMYTFFKLFWIFQKFQDVSKPFYYLMALVSAYLVGLAIYLIHSQETSALSKLREKLITVSFHAVRNTEGEKKEKMLEVIETIVKD